MPQHFQRKPTFFLELERVLDTLYKTPEYSRDTHPHLRGMLFPVTCQEELRFPASSRDEGPLPCFT